MTKTRKIPTFLQKCQVQLVERESVTKCPPMKWLPSETTNTAYLPLSQLSALTLQTHWSPTYLPRSSCAPGEWDCVWVCDTVWCLFMARI